MKTQDFIDIQTICEEGSFRKAAKKLNISQPTLSHRIAYLEQRLGAELFSRSKGASRPTELALQIVERSRRIVTASEHLIRDTYRMASGKIGRIGLGLGPAPAHVFLSQVIEASREKVDQLTLECMIGSTGQLADLLNSNQIDVALCPPDPSLFGQRIQVETLIEGPLIIAGRAGHPFMENPSTDPKEFFKHRLALPLLEPAYKTLARQLYGVDMDQVSGIVYCSDYPTLIQLALNQDCLIAGPGFAFHREVEQGILQTLPLDAQSVRHRLCLITRKDQLPIPALQHVVDCIRQAAKPLARSA